MEADSLTLDIPAMPQVVIINSDGHVENPANATAAATVAEDPHEVSKLREDITSFIHATTKDGMISLLTSLEVQELRQILLQFCATAPMHQLELLEHSKNLSTLDVSWMEC